MSALALLGLGFLLGMRHATDADHVVAVSAVVTRERSLRAAAPIGLLWGVGHTFTILLVGGAIVLFGLVIPPRLGLGLEFCVALMLIALGALNLRAARPTHQQLHAARCLSTLGGLRPLAIGLVHGLAGSAAIALLVLGSIRDAASGVLYLVLFGAGTLVGMLLITTALAVPMIKLAEHSASVQRSLGIVTGLASLVFGAVLAYDIGIVHGLFSPVPSWTPQ